MHYNALTRHYFEHPLCAGDLEGGATVFCGEAGAQDHGTWVRFTVRIASAQAAPSPGAGEVPACGAPSRVVEARFLAFGCPHVIAVAAYLAERAAGTALSASLPEPVAALRERFAAPVDKLGRLLIVEDAWLAAVRAAVAAPRRGL